MKDSVDFFDSDGFEYNGDIILDEIIDNIKIHHPYFFNEAQFENFIITNFDTSYTKEFKTNKYLHRIFSKNTDTDIKKKILELYSLNVLNIPNGYDTRKEDKQIKAEYQEKDLDEIQKLEIWLADYFEALIFTLYLYIEKIYTVSSTPPVPSISSSTPPVSSISSSTPLLSKDECLKKTNEWIINFILDNSIEKLKELYSAFTESIKSNINKKKEEELYDELNSLRTKMEEYSVTLSSTKFEEKTDGRKYIEENIDGGFRGYIIDADDDLYNYF